MGQQTKNSTCITIIHASDFHLRAQGAYAYRVSDTYDGLKRFVAHVKALPFSADLLVVTGDLSDDGSISSYTLVKEQLQSLHIPYYILPGNHDDPSCMYEVFNDTAPYLRFMRKPGTIHSFDYCGIRMVLLNSAHRGMQGGEISDETVKELMQAFKGDQYNILFLHHPPCNSGIGFMDASEYKNKEALLHILEQTPRLLFVACGHIHRAISATVGSMRILVAPSTAMQLHLNLTQQAPGDFVLEEAGYYVHRIVFHDKLIKSVHTYTAQVASKQTFPFDD